MGDSDASEIGQAVRAVRRRRGMSLDAAAGLAGISKSYLSMLETGRRRFDRRGLLEDLARVLGCSVSDLTGQPYQLPDRHTVDALLALSAVSLALHDCSLDDVPDAPARPVETLVELARQANVATDESRYDRAGHQLGELLTELHIHAVSGHGDDRLAALAALAEACFAACGVARQLGHLDLAVLAAGRGREAAAAVDAPALHGFAAMTGAGALLRLGARHRASRVLTTALADAGHQTGPTPAATESAEATGMLHLASAQLAAREGRGVDADTHLAEAGHLAAHTGERNALRFHFGPANVSAWSVAIGVELGRGPAAADSIRLTPDRIAALGSADRRAGLHLDLARAYAQTDDGARDWDAVQHLDTADRIAPQRLRHDPIARELVAQCADRARRRVWELDSLRRRFGLTS